VTDDPGLDAIEGSCYLNGEPIPVISAMEMANLLEDMARSCPPGSEWATRMRRNARAIMRLAVVPTTVVAPARYIAPRPRERREQRHVAQATSSADSGDPPLAVCPVCSDIDWIRHLCSFCGGHGYVHRERRNRYKRGERDDLD